MGNGTWAGNVISDVGSLINPTGFIEDVAKGKNLISSVNEREFKPVVRTVVNLYPYVQQAKVIDKAVKNSNTVRAIDRATGGYLTNFSRFTLGAADLANQRNGTRVSDVATYGLKYGAQTAAIAIGGQAAYGAYTAGSYGTALAAAAATTGATKTAGSNKPNPSSFLRSLGFGGDSFSSLADLYDSGKGLYNDLQPYINPPKSDPPYSGGVTPGSDILGGAGFSTASRKAALTTVEIAALAAISVFVYKKGKF